MCEAVLCISSTKITFPNYSQVGNQWLPYFLGCPVVTGQPEKKSEKLIYPNEPMEDLKEVKYFLQLDSLPFFHWKIHKDSMLRIAQ